MSSSDDRTGDGFAEPNEPVTEPGEPVIEPDEPMIEPDEPEKAPVSGLEAELLALGEALHVPSPAPADVARAVRARLENAARREGFRPSLRPSPRPGRRPTPRKIAAAVAVFLAVLIAATPQGRAAVVSVLRFAGVEIEVGSPGPLPTGLPSPLPSERRVTLGQARREVAFPIAVPAALGDPADVRIADGGRVVSLMWPGIRLDEYDGTLTVVFRKELGPPWPEEVPAIQGWWIQQPHGLTYVPARGGGPQDERVAGPTLIWRHGLVGLRLEGVGREEAIRIARSV